MLQEQLALRDIGARVVRGQREGCPDDAKLTSAARCAL
jgi:hypothetical protein